MTYKDMGVSSLSPWGLWSMEPRMLYQSLYTRTKSYATSSSYERGWSNHFAWSQSSSHTPSSIYGFDERTWPLVIWTATYKKQTISQIVKTIWFEVQSLSGFLINKYIYQLKGDQAFNTNTHQSDRKTRFGLDAFGGCCLTSGTLSLDTIKVKQVTAK